MRLAILTLLIIVIAGAVLWMTSQLSHIGTPPDPNDPRQAGLLTPEVLLNALSGASDNLLERVRKGEISDRQYKDEMAKAANTLLSQVNIDRIPPGRAWKYAEVYITARRWDDAKKALDIAVKAAKNEDRRVNDNLRLARVLAELDQVPEAIRVARSTYDTPPTSAAPILPATLLEIVPAAQHKGHDPELAQLLEDAIKCEARTIVDEKTQPGRDFLLARPIHIAHAWSRIIALYETAGKVDEARAAEIRREKMLSEQFSG